MTKMLVKDVVFEGVNYTAEFTRIDKEVRDILSVKNYSKMPITLDSMLVNLKNAMKFSYYSENARARFARIENRITEFTSALTAKDMNKSSSLINENEIADELLYKRALIHADTVTKRARNTARYLQSELESTQKIESSLARIPFSQRARFEILLSELQDSELQDSELQELESAELQELPVITESVELPV